MRLGWPLGAPEGGRCPGICMTLRLAGLEAHSRACSRAGWQGRWLAEQGADGEVHGALAQALLSRCDSAVPFPQ